MGRRCYFKLINMKVGTLLAGLGSRSIVKVAIVYDGLADVARSIVAIDGLVLVGLHHLGGLANDVRILWLFLRLSHFNDWTGYSL